MLFDFIDYDVKFIYDMKPHSHFHNSNAVFTINCNRVYHQCRIAVYKQALDLYNDGKKDFLVNGLIHELVHVHLDGLSDVAGKRHVTESELNAALEDATEVFAEYVRRYFKQTNKISYN